MYCNHDHDMTYVLPEACYMSACNKAFTVHKLKDFPNSINTERRWFHVKSARKKAPRQNLLSLITLTKIFRNKNHPRQKAPVMLTPYVKFPC